MRLPLISTAFALTFALLSSSLSASAAGTGTVYDLHDIGPGSGAGIVFVDALQQAAGWSSATVAPLLLDPEGNVKSLAPGQTATRVVYTNEAYPAGDYTLLYDGSGIFDVAGGRIVASAQGRATVRIPANDGTGLTLRLLATDPANPARNVRLILPGYEQSYASQPFAPACVRGLLGRSTLRFAQWMHADTYVDSTFWLQRPHVERATQVTPSGVAPEYMILLANLTGSSPWFTLPVGATDAYAYNFAALVHRTLDPRLHPIFEYGNEVWNPATPGNAYARMAAHNTGIAGDPSTAALKWYASRSARIFALVQSAYGRDAARIVRAASGPVPNTPAAAALDAALARQLGASLDAFAVPLSAASGATNVAHLGLPAQAKTVGYAPEPIASAAIAPLASALPLGKARLVLGTDRPQENDVPPRFKQVALPPAKPLSAADPLDLGGRAGIGGALGVPLAQINPSAEGKLDWVQLNGATVAGRKQQAQPQIAVSAAAAGSFSFSVPADRTERVLRVYVSVNRAQGSLVAKLGNATFADSSLADSAATRVGVYTLVYRGTGAGQRLTVSYAPKAGSGGTVAVQAATLFSNAVPIRSTPSDETQYHNDLNRTGWNSNETTLTPANVGTSAFHLLQTLGVDGNVLAQPLYLAGVTIGGSSHNVLVVVTENNTVYEFDADSGTILNQVNLGTAQSDTDVGCLDLRPQYGITPTPVINRATNTIYVLAATEPTTDSFHTYLHALSITTLADQTTPVDIAASTVLNNGSTLSFDPHYNFTRPGLVWANNSVYVSSGSHCDDSHSISGWLIRYNASLTQTGAFSTIGDPTGDCNGFSLAGIWMSGFTPAVDPSGNIYAITGNGAFDASNGGHDYGESVIKVKPDLSGVTSYFTPGNWNSLNCSDGDFGSGGAMLLPKGPAPGPPLLVAMGKSSTIFLLNSGNLGGMTAGNSGALQIIQNSTTRGNWGGPAFFSGPTGQFVYYQSENDYLHAFQVNYSTGGPVPLARGASPNTGSAARATLVLSSTGTSQAGYGGSTPIVSSNGQAPETGIVWLVSRGSGTLNLQAYDAQNVAHLLFNGLAGTWTNPQNNGFVTPLVANGKVYVGSSNAVTVFGL